MNNDKAAKPPLTEEQIDKILSSLRSEGLSDWESKFVGSVRQYWIRNRKLSDKQKTRLAEMWKKQNEKGGGHEPKRA